MTFDGFLLHWNREKRYAYLRIRLPRVRHDLREDAPAEPVRPALRVPVLPDGRQTQDVRLLRLQRLPRGRAQGRLRRQRQFLLLLRRRLLLLLRLSLLSLLLLLLLFLSALLLLLLFLLIRLLLFLLLLFLLLLVLLLSQAAG